MANQYIRSGLCYSELRDHELLLTIPGTPQVIIVSGSGIDLWRWLAKPQTIDDLVAKILKRYPSSEIQVKDDVSTFINQCLQAKMIEKV